MSITFDETILRKESLVNLIFSRKATIEDFNKENKRWEEILPKDVRDAVHNNRNIKHYPGLNEYRKRKYCGIEEAKRVVTSYMSFIEAWEDFARGEDVYVQY